MENPENQLKHELILYGRGLIAEEYFRYLSHKGRAGEVVCFAVTAMNGQGDTYCGRPCLEIEAALAKFPQAEVHLALQEKYHGEVVSLLEKLGRRPERVIGLHRMTELLGEQGIREISTACSELTVRRNPHDYSMLEIAASEHPEEKFTFYPMTQVPLSQEDMAKVRSYVQGNFFEGWGGIKDLAKSASRLDENVLYIAMATSAKDALVSHEGLPDYVHTVLGGAAAYEGQRSGELADDDEGRNISLYNNLYSELTVAYWLWQKAPQTKYLGLCHYRRHFVLPAEVQGAIAKGEIDVLLTRPRLTFPSVREYFANLPVTTMDELDYETMLRLIESEDSELAKFSRDFLEGQIHFPNNMVIAKREIYLDYCRFMFKVLQGMQAEYEVKGIARPDRYLGYVGELLTTVYFAYYRGKYRIDFIDYQLLKEI